MLQEFFLYLKLGLEHLLDIQAPDHILFILMLALPYELKNWKKLFWLATAFTLGHSITLAVAVYTSPSPYFISWIEFLIALSIALTAIFNLLKIHLQKALYTLVMIFGFIHGYGFSGLLKSLLENMDFRIVNTLLPFNLGLEIAQIIWISIILFINTFWKYPLKFKLIIYFLTLVISIVWAYQRIPFSL
ncbi:MAG: hypothetical protein KatS3mg035_1304 [Bacteroidia bacterium]|nr:MAG: hypothetical protein KatS3mg035_1304 [Bacteroidia bacterium]